MSYPLALAWAIGVATALKLTVIAIAKLRPAAATDIVNLGACEVLIFTLGIAAVVRLHGTKSTSHTLAIRSTSPALSLLGLALGFAVHVPAESIRALMERLAPTPSDVLAARAALLSADSPARVALVLYVVACSGPLVEELFFRGALYTTLRRQHAVMGAAVTTAIAFVFGHLDYRMWMPLLVVSAVLTYLRVASGSLLPSLALHVGFNTVTILGLVTGASSIGSPMELGNAALLLGWLATLGLLAAVQYVASRSDEARISRSDDELS